MEFIRNQYIRLGATTAFILALIWLLWPVSPFQFDTKALLACISTGIVWLSAELINLQSEPSPRVQQILLADSSRFKEVQKLFTNDAVLVLEEDDMNGPVHKQHWLFLTRFSNQYSYGHLDEFYDLHLKNEFDSLRAEIEQFLEEFRTLMHEENGIYSWKSPNLWLSDEEYNRRRQEGYKLNRKAKKIANCWREFHKTAHLKLKGYL